MYELVKQYAGATLFSADPTGISSTVRVADADSRRSVYNLYGQKVSPDSKGLVIINGRKVFKR